MPGLISAADMASMQADVNTTLDTPVEVQRASKTQGNTGNVKPAYAHLASYQGNLAQPTAGQLANYAYKIANRMAWRVRLPAVGVDVQEADHLVVAGHTLEVQVVLAPESYSTATIVLATEVK